jgi:hypothetical protein
MTSLLLMVTLLLLMFMLLLSSNAPALVHAVADIHAVAGVSSVVGRIVTGTFALALALVHAVSGTQDAVIRVSAVVGLYCYWSPCIMMLQKCLAVVYSSTLMPESFRSRRETFYIPPCRKNLPVPG